MDISSDKREGLNIAMKGKNKRKLHTLLIAIQSNVIKTNYLKAQIDKT